MENRRKKECVCVCVSVLLVSQKDESQAFPHPGRKLEKCYLGNLPPRGKTKIPM